jgi:aldehyde dehydrogenase (NAD+)
MFLDDMRTFFDSGATRSYAFRKKQLHLLKRAIEQYEQAIYEALYADLKKSPEECWVTENGMVLGEINQAIKNLHRWMKPARVSTNLLNQPSSSRIYAEPLGVVLVVGPWNYPFQLPIKPAVGAIAAGNCVVIKTSEFAPATSAILKKIISETFDPNYIRLVGGDGAQVVPHMMRGFDFDHVFFTGSTAVGQRVYALAAEKLTPVTLELGGKSPCMVEPDANLRVAARRIVLAKFSNCGQMCIAPDYILVHHSVKEALVQQLRETIQSFFGDDASACAHYGKIINEKQFNRLLDYLQQNNIIHGGTHDLNRLFIEPTLIDQPDLNSPIMQEEIFGPLLPIIGYESREQALATVRKNKNPLAMYVFTESGETEQFWLDAIPAGGGCINNASWHLTNHRLPFGGRGHSGIGNYQGKYSFDRFSHQKAILKTPTWFDPNVKYPPFTGKLNLFKWVIGK